MINKILIIDSMVQSSVRKYEYNLIATTISVLNIIKKKNKNYMNSDGILCFKISCLQLLVNFYTMIYADNLTFTCN